MMTGKVCDSRDVRGNPQAREAESRGPSIPEPVADVGGMQQKMAQRGRGSGQR